MDGQTVGISKVCVLLFIFLTAQTSVYMISCLAIKLSSGAFSPTDSTLAQ